MSWEALRLTSKSPAELYQVMGPNGVDALVRQMLADCWNDLPADGRTLKAWRARAGEILERNLGVWHAIRKPSPAAFFEDLLPHPADGHLRQAMVLAWMMLPRGKRDLPDVLRFVRQVYDRNVRAWEDDDRTLANGVSNRTKAVKATKTSKTASRKTAKKSAKKPARKAPVKSPGTRARPKR